MRARVGRVGGHGTIRSGVMAVFRPFKSSGRVDLNQQASTADETGQHGDAHVASVGPWQPWRLLYRTPLLLLLCLIGLPLLLFALLPGIRRLPVFGRSLGWRAQRRYARALVWTTGMRLRVHGELPRGPMLVVANHISWFDIPVLHALSPMWLVAKHDIRDWLLVGPLARAVGTIFIARGDEASRRAAARRMAALLKRGRVVGVFPEGGIRPERGVNRFHARLLGPAIRSGTPILPAAIRYWRDGDVHDERVFSAGKSFAGLLISNMARPPCEAQVFLGRPLATDGDSLRGDLAKLAQQQVTEMYGHAAR